MVIGKKSSFTLLTNQYAAGIIKFFKWEKYMRDNRTVFVVVVVVLLIGITLHLNNSRILTIWAFDSRGSFTRKNFNFKNIQNMYINKLQFSSFFLIPIINYIFFIIHFVCEFFLLFFAWKCKILLSCRALMKIKCLVFFLT